MVRSYNKHGLTNRRLYGVLRDIRERCYNKTDQAYKNYGAKGVRVCDGWLNNPEVFIKWALANGWKPGMQIDKDIKASDAKRPALLYSPEWCSVVTPKENNKRRVNSRLYTINGETKNLTEWGEYYNIDITTILHRINKLGWDEVKAITTVNHKRRRKIKMEDAERIRDMRISGIPCKDIAEIYGMDVSNVFLIVQNKTWKSR